MPIWHYTEQDSSFSTRHNHCNHNSEVSHLRLKKRSAHQMWLQDATEPQEMSTNTAQ